MPSDPFASTDIQPSRENLDGSALDVDPRLIELSRLYLAALRAGKNPRREEYLARYLDLPEKASDYLEGIEMAFSLEQANVKPGMRTLDQPDSKQGEPIGDFRIGRELGRGGMGIVYEATQISLGRQVALKVLPFAAALDQRHRKRFLLEAQAAAQLHHQNIVPVYAVGCERGTHYYAMQLIDGEPISAKLFDESESAATDLARSTIKSRADMTLRQSCVSDVSLHKSRQTRYQRIAALVADAAEALEYAHSCGIVHRDVKPGNLLLDVRGKLWITDFGLAHITSGEHVTQTGEMLGTMRYMSPEQASGSRGVIDHRSDVYSLGATLYELLTGEPVFNGGDRQTLLNQVLHSDPRPLRQIDRATPEELETITLKALRHSPSDRYQTAQEFADDLHRYLNEMPIAARNPTLVDKTRKWMRRHPTTVLSMLFALTFAMILFAVATAVVAHQKSLTQQSLLQAERRLATAQAAADEMISLAENEFSMTPMEEVLRLRLLSSALIYYQALTDDPDLEPKTLARLRNTRDNVQKLYDDLMLLRDDRHLAYLADPSVIADLKLDSVQLEQLAKVRSFATVSDDDNLRVKEARERKLAINRILTPDQRLRLKQIATQLRGPSAILEMLISGELKLTEAQMTAIQGSILGHLLSKTDTPMGNIALKKIQETLDPIPSKSDSFGPDALMDAETKREVVSVILEQLTPEQRQAWSDSIGPKFVPQ